MKINARKYTKIALILVFSALVVFFPDALFAETAATAAPTSAVTAAPAADAAPAAPSKDGGNWAGEMILRLSATIFGLAGALFDYSITELVIKTGELLGTGTSLGNTVNNIWTIIRDLCNLAFVFFFFYVGIKTIIERDVTFAKQTIAKLIIGALLINFSLFFAKVVIDVSNVAAVQIYKVLNPTTYAKPGLSLTNSMGINNLYGVTIADEKGAVKILVDTNKDFTWYIIASIFLLITAFTFLISSIMLVVRFIILTLGMILSPLMFILALMPAALGSIKKTGEDFQRSFMQSAFFPVIFLFLILIAINVLSNTDIGKNGSITQIGGKGDDQFTYILRFALSIGFILAALKASKFGAETAGNFATKWTKKGIGAVAIGGAALAARQTFGRGAHAIAEDKDKMADLQRRAAEGSTSARLALKTIVGTQKASFDVRQSSAMKYAAGTATGKKLGMGDYGTGVSKEAETHKQDQGFAGRKKAAEMQVSAVEEEKAKALPKFDEKDPLVARRIADEKAAIKVAGDAKQKLSSATSRLSDLQKNPPDSTATQQVKDKYNSDLKAAEDDMNKKHGIFDEAEKNKTDAIDRTERERNRHQVGSTFRKSDFVAAEGRKTTNEGLLAAAQSELGLAGNDTIKQQTAIRKIEEAQKNIKSENDIIAQRDNIVENLSDSVRQTEIDEKKAKRNMQAKLEGIRQNREKLGALLNAGPVTPEQRQQLDEENKRLNQELETAQKSHKEAKKIASETYGGRVGVGQRQGHLASALRARFKSSTQGGIEDRAKKYTKKPEDEKKK